MNCIGLDVGSTTVKIAILDQNEIVYSKYRRHYSDIKKNLSELLSEALSAVSGDNVSIAVTGSGGISAAKWLSIPFVQEVSAAAAAIENLLPKTDVAIELGGEDAKITYLSGGVEQRMNGICAGGTGAFIDQMASLLNTDLKGLNELAKGYETIYPIASRCGVFAKSDIQPLLNDGARKEDIAASVFKSVVNQTISGLACGRPIRGKVAFLGGPLHFLCQLRKSFIETLNLSPEDVIFPENANLFVAVGCALSENRREQSVDVLKRKIEALAQVTLHEVERLKPLFENQEQLKEFTARHSRECIPKARLDLHNGAAYLGVDMGSTTTKAVLINGDGEILFSRYENNMGDPLKSATDILKKIYNEIPERVYIAKATATGYGEHLVKAALRFDFGEVETMAHFKAARKLLPGVEFILDIGGQDMKCIRVKDGQIENILLNEACSGGCGSFIENFANALGMSTAEFSKAGLNSKAPVDLGSRCTVFMNSRVKQAQKEGASVFDISAGLSYSVIKNALFKVIKIREPEQMGEKIIVQGGTFLNNSVLRAFELIAGREVYRPDAAGLMGAYGSALIALEHDDGNGSLIVERTMLDNFNIEKSTTHCKRCPNNCLLTISKFPDGSKYITNNRCEKNGEPSGAKNGELRSPSSTVPPNLYEWRYRRVFDYPSLPPEKATRGVVGIPRVLGLYENYPFWFAFFTKLGYSVKLSPESSRAVYDMGIETMPSESVCYPAKLAHGHITALLNEGVRFIFYPSLPYEMDEGGGDDHYNCPVVATYSEVIRNSVPQLRESEILFMNPFLPIYNKKRMAQRLSEEFSGIEYREIAQALDAAYAASEQFKRDLRAKGEEVLNWLKETGQKGFVLAGRPYHVDPEIHHGIPEMINSCGFAVLSEDSISHLGKINRPIRVVDQWMYHTRLYAAATVVGENPQLELVQLNSFGCGPDAVCADQVAEILAGYGKMHTLLKIDEVNNLGAARIRLRSLISVMQERDKADKKPFALPTAYKRQPLFTNKMRKRHTILAPQMSPIHFDLLEAAFVHSGYNFVVLKEHSKRVVDTGLKYVNNDACYPAILTIGQLLTALESGEYELENTSVIISQTGGACRATNYAGMLKKALRDGGFKDIPLISLNAVGIEKNPGFKLTVRLALRGLMALIYGDLLSRCLYKVRPHEIEKGAAQRAFEKWNVLFAESLRKHSFKTFRKNCRMAVREFAKIPVYETQKTQVGIVGEILVKYHPTANNNIVDLVEAEGAQAVVPDLMGFLFYCCDNANARGKLLTVSKKRLFLSNAAVKFIEWLSKDYIEECKAANFGAPMKISQMRKLVDGIVSTGNIAGEGWFLSAEMMELMHDGVNNIICLQPFACLPNHVTGKGVIGELKRQNPHSNIIAVDYDPGASEVNQLNRIKLMLSQAFKKSKSQERAHGRTALK
ncbi:MAG: 2-hydroxyacyl-CoA dehydratase [Oscillospiraceae bacterium]|nr:2-hydroxyacyl-CoA dehydratase [Oscillospiraceae bacterium]